MIETLRRCTDKKCKHCGEKLVDRGYGYPVCPSSPPKMDDGTYSDIDKIEWDEEAAEEEEYENNRR